MSNIGRNDYTEHNFDRLASLFKALEREDPIGESIARRLVEKCTSVEGLFATPAEELAQVISPEDAAFIRLLGAVTSRRVTDKFKFGIPHSQYEICEYLKAAFLCDTAETVRVIALGKDGSPLCCRTVSHGTVNASDITVRSIVEVTFAAGSSRAVIAHNHPRGVAKPSEEDGAMTNTLVSALEKAGVTLEYHVVVAGQECDVIECQGDGDDGSESNL